jgi:membrane fusion protein, multidrug efflux system
MNAMTKKDAVAQAAPPSQTAPAPQKKRSGRIALMLALPVLLALGGGYVWLTGGRYETTENANLQQALVSISAAVSGRVTEVFVQDNMVVKSGDPLFQVDPEPYRIALAESDAALAAARLSVAQMRAAYAQAAAQADVVRGDVDYFQTEYDRQKALSVKGVVTASGLDGAARDLSKAEENKVAADQAVLSALAALGGTPDAEIDAHPAVMAALAARDQKAYDLAHTVVTAPADGIVAQAASFKLGEYVTPGSPLFALVETGESWVDANFKETQLGKMQVGQASTVEFDTYPGRDFTAHVTSIGAATGAEFSLIPPQNATGNWVKVTQRIPVRLTLDPTEALPLLRTGMSAKVSVDTLTAVAAATAATE